MHWAAKTRCQKVWGLIPPAPPPARFLYECTNQGAVTCKDWNSVRGGVNLNCWGMQSYAKLLDVLQGTKKKMSQRKERALREWVGITFTGSMPHPPAQRPGKFRPFLQFRCGSNPNASRSGFPSAHQQKPVHLCQSDGLLNVWTNTKHKKIRCKIKK